MSTDIRRRPPGRVIEARDVRLSFGQTPALRGTSVGVAAGEMLAIMGPSGSGKSTLLHCMAGILVPATDRGGRSVATGFLAAQLFLRSQLGYTLRPPGIGYYLIVAAGLVVSLGIIGSTLPLLRRMTGPDVVRNE